MTSYIIKFIFRSWWRNKLFFIISILSLAVGLACVNLLLSFVIYESDIETDNPNRDKILYMSQPFPMDTTKSISYIVGEVTQTMKNNYPEIEDYVRFQDVDVLTYSINNKTLSGITFISADSSFTRFFPYEALHGDLAKAFSSPNKVAITESFAAQVFGETYPVGQFIRVMSSYGEQKETDYEVVAVIKNRNQSLLAFDAITLNPSPFYGGPTFLMTNKQINSQEFGIRLKADGVPTLQVNVGQYSFSTIQECYFSNFPNETIPYLKRQQPILLSIGWITALLILLIACINYTNLNYSRLLEQVKLIKIQRIMGASSFQVGLHLFIDTFLTLIFSFLFSVLIAHDLIPAFNAIVSGRLSTAFFFSGQVFPVLLFLLILFAVSVSLFMSYRLIKIPIQVAQQHYSMQKKQQTIRTLSIIQYAISIGLVATTITVHRQLGLVKQGGDNYQQVFEIGSYNSDTEKVRLFADKVKEIPEIASVTTSDASILSSLIRQLVIKDKEGNESYSSLLLYRIGGNFMQTLSIDLLQGLPPEEAKKVYAQPVYVNQEFIHLLVPKNENPIGRPLAGYYPSLFEPVASEGEIPQNSSTIAGVISNFHTLSFENRVQAQLFSLDENVSTHAQIKLHKTTPQLMEQIEAIWNEVAPSSTFYCENIFQQYMARNVKLTEFYNLIMMYAVISLFLTAFGLFGTAYYTTTQRTKEIGIRRVNGATDMQIALLLNRRFLKWICIALVITIPPVWLLLQEWLQYFIYRIKISVDIFIIAGIIVAGITLLGVSWHSYRAVTRNPVKSIRNE